MIDFALLAVKPDRLSDAVTKAGKPKRGFVKLRYGLSMAQSEVYDLRGKVATPRQFANWVKRQFGELPYEIILP